MYRKETFCSSHKLGSMAIDDVSNKFVQWSADNPKCEVIHLGGPLMWKIVNRYCAVLVVFYKERV